jgi:tetratricopeptide (TPR) repeat protein
MNDQVKSILVNGAVIAVICMLLFLAGTWWRMSTQFRLGEEALRKGDFPNAVAGFESALHMYIPFHPTIEKSAHELWKIGENNEKLGDVARALIAYRALRSSFYAAHWLITPGEEWIARCDKKIAALVPLQRER